MELSSILEGSLCTIAGKNVELRFIDSTLQAVPCKSLIVVTQKPKKGHVHDLSAWLEAFAKLIYVICQEARIVYLSSWVIR